MPSAVGLGAVTAGLGRAGRVVVADLGKLQPAARECRRYTSISVGNLATRACWRGCTDPTFRHARPSADHTLPPVQAHAVTAQRTASRRPRRLLDSSHPASSRRRCRRLSRAGWGGVAPTLESTTCAPRLSRRPRTAPPAPPAPSPRARASSRPRPAPAGGRSRSTWPRRSRRGTSTRWRGGGAGPGRRRAGSTMPRNTRASPGVQVAPAARRSARPRCAGSAGRPGAASRPGGPDSATAKFAIRTSTLRSCASYIGHSGNVP